MGAEEEMDDGVDRNAQGRRSGSAWRSFPWLNVVVLCVTLATFALSVVHTYRANVELNARVLTIAGNATPAIEHLSRARGALLRLQLDVANAVERSQAGHPQDPAPFDATLRTLHRELAAYRAIPFLPHERDLGGVAEASIAQVEEQLRLELRQLAAGDLRAAAAQRSADLWPAVARADDALADLVTFNAEEQRRLSMDIRAEQLHASEVGYALYGLSLLLALVLLLLVLRNGRRYALLLGREKKAAERRANESAGFSARLQALASSSVAISDTITRSTDLRAMLRQITEEARAVVRATSCTLRLGAEEAPVPAVVLSSVSESPAPSGPTLAMPIPHGELVLARAEGQPPFSGDDAVVAELFAAHAGVAIENARLYNEAQAATRAREDLLAAVSHDLRSPLNAIHLAAGVLCEEPGASDDTKRLVTRIDRSVDRMNRLIHDLLDAAQIEAGRLSAHVRPEDLRAIVEEAAEGFTGAASAHSVELSTELPSLPVLCERDLVLRVLSNLIGNALKFTPPHGRIAVTAASCDGEVEIAVCDTGPGIPAGDLQHLFDRYWQQGADRRGSGLGLYIARGIVEAHRGRIWVESKLGEGSTFHFTLPAAA